MTTTARTLIVIPTYNEVDNLPSLIRGLRANMPEVDLLIVDDTSPDGTGKVADEYAAYDRAITVIHRAGKPKGFAASYLDGFAWGLWRGYDAIVEMDADGSHRIEDLPNILEALTNADLVLGSRWTAGGSTTHWPWFRQLLSRGGSLYARLLLGIPAQDLTTGFRAYRASTLRTIDLAEVRSSGYAFQIELAHRINQAGLIITEVPIVFVERTSGASKMTSSIAVEAIVQVARMSTSRVRPSKH